MVIELPVFHKTSFCVFIHLIFLCDIHIINTIFNINDSYLELYCSKRINCEEFQKSGIHCIYVTCNFETWFTICVAACTRNRIFVQVQTLLNEFKVNFCNLENLANLDYIFSHKYLRESCI